MVRRSEEIKGGKTMRFVLVVSLIAGLINMVIGDIAPTVFFTGMAIIATMMILHDG